MTYESVYDAVADLYDPSLAWERMVKSGSRESFNVAEEALGRHADSSETALRVRDFGTGESERHSFAELNRAANRVSNYLEAHTERHHRVGAMLEPSLELYAVLFGTIKAGRVYVPLSPLFGPDALNYRLNDSGATVLVTGAGNLDSVDSERLDDLETILVVGDGEGVAVPGVETQSYDVVADYGTEHRTVETHPRDAYAIKYTSGTTGHPKGCVTNHLEFLAHHAFLEHVVDLQPDDNYFVAASPAWSYGMRSGALSPGVFDTAIGSYRGKFEIGMLLDTLERFEITNLMLPPTGLRQLQASDSVVADYDIDLRVLVSAGEALQTETVAWCEKHFGVRPLDAYGLTEAGKMVICNYNFPDWKIKPGSMGKPMPTAEVVLRDEDGNEIRESGEVGEITIERNGPYKGYWGKPDQNLQTFRGQWLHTGDTAYRDNDGYYWFASRKDDLILSAGYRIGPDEVEATLLKHEAVQEAAVVGVPDDTRGQIAKAYVALSSRHEPSDDLIADLRSFTRSELSKHEYPREIEIVEGFSKTASGKIKKGELP